MKKIVIALLCIPLALNSMSEESKKTSKKRFFTSSSSSSSASSSSAKSKRVATPDLSQLHLQDKKEKSCPICICNLSDEAIKTLECGHTYHDECITPWIIQGNGCALCRFKPACAPSIPEEQKGFIPEFIESKIREHGGFITQLCVNEIKQELTLNGILITPLIITFIKNYLNTRDTSLDSYYAQEFAQRTTHLLSQAGEYDFDEDDEESSSESSNSLEEYSAQSIREYDDDDYDAMEAGNGPELTYDDEDLNS